MNWQAWSKDDDVDLDCLPGTMNRRIWQERIKLGLTREHVCETAGMKIAYLKGLETRERPPTIIDIGRLAKLFGMDIQYIITGQRIVTVDEAALLDNYRNSTPENKTVIRKVSAALEKQVGDDGEMCA